MSKIITHENRVSHECYFQVLRKSLLSLLKVLKIRLVKADTSSENIPSVKLFFIGLLYF